MSRTGRVGAGEGAATRFVHLDEAGRIRQPELLVEGVQVELRLSDRRRASCDNRDRLPRSIADD